MGMKKNLIQIFTYGCLDAKLKAYDGIQKKAAMKQILLQ